MDIRKAREDLRKGKTIYEMPLRVVYYARVSTDKDDQLNSLENQQNYFEEMIKENNNWTFCGGYIDEGISGTAVKNREQFLKMIESSTLDKIDLILTKEISRFSRNTVDSIKYTEYLLKNGVIVYFLSDNLNTIQEDAEFRLTIMSSLAQDEVRKLSERVKFGINRMIKDRKLIGGNLTGYFKKDGKYEINEKEAPIVRYLFETYVSGQIGLKKIGENLAKMGYLNSKGEVYSQTSMAKMLSNPRYKGYYTARLSEVENYKTHKKVSVAKDKQIIEKDDRIPAIVSEELWDRANILHNTRKKHPAYHVLNREDFLENSKYSCKLYCKECGNVFIRSAGSNRKISPTWSCKKYKTEGVNNCASPIIKEDYLDKVFINIFDNFIDNKKIYLDTILSEYKNIMENEKNIINVDEINKQITVIEKQKDKLLDLSLKGMISDSEFKKRNDNFNIDIQNLQLQIKQMDTQDIELKKMKEKISELRKSLSNKLDISKELPHLMKLLIDRVEIEKINNNRKHIRMIVYFNFNVDHIDRELNWESNKSKKGRNTLANFYGLKCSYVPFEVRSDEHKNIEKSDGSLEKSGERLPNFVPVDQKQSRICYIRSKIR